MNSLQASIHARDLTFVVLGALLSAAAGVMLIALPSPGIVIAPIALVLGGLLALRLPGAVFAAYLYIPFYKGVVDPYVPIDLTVLLAITCMVIALPLVAGQWDDELLRSMSVWGALLAVVAIGTLYAPDLNLALTQLMYFGLLVYFPLFLGVRIVRDSKLLDQFLVATVILSVIVTLAGLLQLSGLGAYDRVAAMSNTIGTARSAFLLPIILSMLIRFGSRWLALLSLAVTPFAIFVAIASGSRGPLLTAAITIVTMQLLSRERLGRKLLTGVLIAVISVFVLQSPQIQALLPRQSVWRLQSVFDALFGTGEVENLSSSRTQLFHVATEMFFDRPILGYGTAGFESVVQGVWGLEQFSYPHNLVLQTAAEFGLVGLVVAAIIVISGFVRGIGAVVDPRHQAVFALTLFAFLNAMVSSGFYDNRWMWGMLLMSIAIPPKTDTDVEQQGPGNG